MKQVTKEEYDRNKQKGQLKSIIVRSCLTDVAEVLYGFVDNFGIFFYHQSGDTYYRTVL
jgi:hypothetical protein